VRERDGSKGSIPPVEAPPSPLLAMAWRRKPNGVVDEGAQAAVRSSSVGDDDAEETASTQRRRRRFPSLQRRT
jgi:hypothetical protein